MTIVQKSIRNAVLFASLLWAFKPVYAQIDNLDTQLAAVAKLHVHEVNGSDAYAAAIYVGRSAQSAYFITADHAVRSGNVITAASVDLQFRSSPGAIPATIFDSHSVGADLAIVSIPVGSLPQQLPQLSVANVKSDTRIHIIGHPGGGAWSVWAGILENENVGSGDISHFTTSVDQSLAGGYSGGPVFDSPGFFLGMHINVTNTYGVALKATDIVLQLKAWNVPDQNLEPSIIGVSGSWSGQHTLLPDKGSRPVYIIFKLSQNGATVDGEMNLKNELGKSETQTVRGTFQADGSLDLTALPSSRDPFTMHFQGKLPKGASSISGKVVAADTRTQGKKELSFPGIFSITRTP